MAFVQLHMYEIGENGSKYVELSEQNEGKEKTQF